MCPFSPLFPLAFDGAYTLASLVLLATSVCFGLCSTKSTRARQVTDFPALSTLPDEMNAFCWNVIRASASWTCCVWLPRLQPPSALVAFVRCPFAHGSVVNRNRLCLRRGNLLESSQKLLVWNLSISSVCQHASANESSIVIQIIWAETFQSWHCPVRKWPFRVPRLCCVRPCRLEVRQYWHQFSYKTCYHPQLVLFS